MTLISRNKKTRKIKQTILLAIFIGAVFGSLVFLLTKNWTSSTVASVFIITLIIAYSIINSKLKKSTRIKRMETVFPDFLQLMSSNLRAGITIEKAMLLASREEFEPLNKEIIQTGKDITTGKRIELALNDMSKRIGSEKIGKTIQLINSGINAGGDLAILLEETASNMRERGFVEKKAASNVLMYVIFIFVAVAIGAPALFGLSSVLVEILKTLIGDLPASGQTPSNIPFTISSLEVSTNFIKYFSIVFILATDVLASLIIGLVNKGEEKEGLKYLLPLIVISLSVFFLIRFLLSNFLTGLF